MNREQWLQKLAAAALPKISSRLDMADEEPAVKLSCGWMPDYPHAAITIPDRKKQSTRLIKVACLNDNYITRISRATVDAMGCPICPACNLEMVVC